MRFPFESQDTIRFSFRLPAYPLAVWFAHRTRSAGRKRKTLKLNEQKISNLNAGRRERALLRNPLSSSKWLSYFLKSSKEVSITNLVAELGGHRRAEIWAQPEISAASKPLNGLTRKTVFESRRCPGGLQIYSRNSATTITPFQFHRLNQVEKEQQLTSLPVIRSLCELLLINIQAP